MKTWQWKNEDSMQEMKNKLCTFRDLEINGENIIWHKASGKWSLYCARWTEFVKQVEVIEHKESIPESRVEECKRKQS